MASLWWNVSKCFDKSPFIEQIGSGRPSTVIKKRTKRNYTKSINQLIQWKKEKTDNFDLVSLFVSLDFFCRKPMLTLIIIVSSIFPIKSKNFDLIASLLVEMNGSVQSKSKYWNYSLQCFVFIFCHAKNFKLIEWVMFMNHLTVIELNWSDVWSVYMFVCRTLEELQRRFIAIELCASVYTVYDDRKTIHLREEKKKPIKRTHTQLLTNEKHSQLSIEIRWRYLHFKSHNKRFMKYFFFFTWTFRFSSFWKGN